MKVKMLTSMASHDCVYSYGEEVEVDDEVGAAWVEGGLASAVGTTKKKVSTPSVAAVTAITPVATTEDTVEPTAEILE